MNYRTGLAAFALAGLTASAQAADLEDLTLKDPIPDNLTWHGVTVYGAVDVDYTYQTHGVPVNGAFYPGVEYNISGSKNANKAISTIAESGLEQSKIGLKIEEAVGNGWTVIGKIEAGFQPLSGELADACASMVRNNGVPLAAQSANSDGSRCGQAFSGPAFAGVSHPGYGTLTAGRQQSLELDAISVYDPMGLPYAFSLIGYSGGTATGFGNTETGRWDNSVKYVYQNGPVHIAAMYSDGGQDTALFGGGYAFDAGAGYRGFSFDAVYERERSAISSSSIPYNTSGAAGTCNATGIGGGNLCPAGNVLNGTVTDGEGWSVMGKYTYEFASGFKDEGPAAKLSFFAGYVHTQLTDPEGPVAAGSTTIGGYEYASINNEPYAPGSGKTLQTAWTGARYELPSGLSFTGAYYRLEQDAYLANGSYYDANGIKHSGAYDCAQGTASNTQQKGLGRAFGETTGAMCSGALNQGSFLVDYQFNKHFDVYSGISYSEAGGGLSSGFLSNNTAVFVTGTRLRF
ncbi:MAG: porin [Rhodomicrobium sp.]